MMFFLFFSFFLQADYENTMLFFPWGIAAVSATDVSINCGK